MKKLDKTINRKGFTYIQMNRGKTTVLYKQMTDYGVVGYEVFKLRVKKERTINGITILEHEQFPSDESFGKWAWSFYTYETALRRFSELEKGRNGDVRPSENKGQHFTDRTRAYDATT